MNLSLRFFFLIIIIIYNISWYKRCMVFWGTVAHCNPSKFHSFQIQTSVDNQKPEAKRGCEWIFGTVMWSTTVLSTGYVNYPREIIICCIFTLSFKLFLFLVTFQNRTFWCNVWGDIKKNPKKLHLLSRLKKIWGRRSDAITFTFRQIPLGKAWTFYSPNYK